MLDNIMDWVKGIFDSGADQGADAVSGLTETAQGATGGAADEVIGVAGDHYGEQFQDAAAGAEGQFDAAQEQFADPAAQAQEAFADPAAAAQEQFGAQADAAGQAAEGHIDAAGQAVEDPGGTAADALRDGLADGR